MSINFSIIDPTTDQIAPVEVDANETVENLKVLVEVEFGIPVSEQLLRFNNQNLSDKEQIKKYGVQQNDVIIVIKRKNTQNQQRLPQFNNNNAQNQQNQVLMEAQQMKKYYEDNPQQLQYILHQNPELANMVLSDNPNDLVNYINAKKQEQMKVKMEQMQRYAQLESDPFNADSQKQIEKEIQKKNIQNNLELAHEHLPENFGQITMLYIEITVVKVPVQAFVDSGAQSTIMSRSCAERCGIMRLVDKRYAGMAVGVGTQKIIGRIHMIDIQIMDKFIPCSLTILDGDNIDFLLGLDMLKRFQCSIDLNLNKLIFPTAGIQVPFLGEGDIKKHISFDQEKQLLEQHEKEQLQIQGKQGTKQETQQPKQSNEQDITSLTNMGFSRQEAEQALKQTGGNVEMAAALLTQKKYGF